MCDPELFVFLCISLLITCVASFENNKTTDVLLLTTGNQTKILSDTPKKNEPHSTGSKKNTITVAEGVNLSPDQFSINLNGKIPMDHAEKSTVVARKGVDSYPAHGREGVTTQPESDSENKATSLALPSEQKNLRDSNNLTEISTDKTIGLSIGGDKIELSINKTTELPTTVKEVKKIFKPKPTATIGGIFDVVKQPIVSLPTKTPPLGMPTKINYVVPVIITLLILPIFLFFMVFLYRNGKECWEKRHYRRMDFLIDGMYNE